VVAALIVPRNVVHITGASGAGVTTLGLALAQQLGRVHLDTDDFYWLPTAPPYREKRPVEDRIARIKERLEDVHPAVCILSGSLESWGDPLIPFFDAVVFLTVPVQVRLERLRRREKQRFGAEALALGGPMHEQHEAFIAWAAAYEAGTMPGRSLPRHEQWLKQLLCPVLRLDGTKTIDELVRSVCRFLNGETA